jgi:hypothetical protein
MISGTVVRSLVRRGCCWMGGRLPLITWVAGCCDARLRLLPQNPGTGGVAPISSPRAADRRLAISAIAAKNARRRSP